MTYQELCALSKEQLQKEPCRCVRCDTCRGTGLIPFRDPFRSFDNDAITCHECERGTVEQCDRCSILIEIEHDEELAEE